jgi:hypothetical protein
MGTEFPKIRREGQWGAGGRNKEPRSGQENLVPFPLSLVAATLSHCELPPTARRFTELVLGAPPNRPQSLSLACCFESSNKVDRSRREKTQW